MLDHACETSTRSRSLHIITCHLLMDWLLCKFWRFWLLLDLSQLLRTFLTWSDLRHSFASIVRSGLWRKFVLNVIATFTSDNRMFRCLILRPGQRRFLFLPWSLIGSCTFAFVLLLIDACSFSWIGIWAISCSQRASALVTILAYASLHIRFLTVVLAV